MRYYEEIHSLTTLLGTPCKYLIKWLVCVYVDSASRLRYIEFRDELCNVLFCTPQMGFVRVGEILHQVREDF